MAAMASRSTIGLPPLAIIASGSKPVVSGGAAMQIEFEHTPVGDSRVPGGVDPPAERAKVVDPGDAGQKCEHPVSLPTRREYRRRPMVRAAGEVSGP